MRATPPSPTIRPIPRRNVKDTYTDVFAGRASTDPAFNEEQIGDKPIRPPLPTDKDIAGLIEVNAQRRESLLSAQDSLVDIVRALKPSDQPDDTYLFFISDNGYLIGEHRFRGGKVAPYEVSVKVPMLVRAPGITPGTWCGSLPACRTSRPPRLRHGHRVPVPRDNRPARRPDLEVRRTKQRQDRAVRPDGRSA